MLGAYLAGAAIEVVKLFVERARPEEVLGAQVLLSHDRSWAASGLVPSGHLIVTAAMATAAAAAVPALRRPLVAYVVVVAFTRVLFGAHFPLDVLVGAVLGYEFGLFAARLMASARLLPAHRARTAGAHRALTAGQGLFVTVSCPRRACPGRRALEQAALGGADLDGRVLALGSSSGCAARP